MSELMLDVGQANELKLAFRRAEWTPADIKRLCEGNLALKLLPVVRGLGDVIIVKHVIDMDTAPYIPNGLRFDPEDQLQNQVHGQVEWNLKKFQLYLSEHQTTGKKWIGGKDLQKELESHLVYNANALDYLLVHPELIPEEWKGKCVFFWGTIYRDSDGPLCVRCLCWHGESWDWGCDWLDYDFFSYSPAAVAGK